MNEPLPPQSHLTPLARLLSEEIRSRGALRFDTFMNQALYHRQYGYYMQARERIGKAGDFFTSSSVHALFGRLIARQLAEMAELLQTETFEVVEQGPGEGHLALDILDALAEEEPGLYDRLRYTLVEVSPNNRERQAKTLAAHADRIFWANGDDWSLTAGCFLSNELVDAFPVHLVEKHDGQLYEVFVLLDEERGGFVEELRPVAGGPLQDHLTWLGVAPAEGSRAEINLLAPAWMRQVARQIERGFVLTIDYGYPAEELYAPHRRQGTLMCYRHHQADDNPYDHVGEKDITSHVNFSALQKAGKEAGLETLWFGEQYRFLLGLGFFEELVRLEAATDDERQARALRLTLKNLIMPEAGMGETFKILVQGKQVGNPMLRCSRPVAAIPFG